MELKQVISFWVVVDPEEIKGYTVIPRVHNNVI